MAQYFHVDRSKRLSAALKVDLQIFTDVDPVELQDHLSRLLPDGVTVHGDQYFVAANQALDTSPSIELVFEYVRRTFFPERPSRYQSFFAAPTIDHARAFGRKYGGGQPFSIWEVEAEEAFITDMDLLSHAGSTSSLHMSWSAHRYWAGEPTESPMLEALLRPPVRIVREIESWTYTRDSNYETNHLEPR